MDHTHFVRWDLIDEIVNNRVTIIQRGNRLSVLGTKIVLGLFKDDLEAFQFKADLIRTQKDVSAFREVHVDNIKNKWSNNKEKTA